MQPYRNALPTFQRRFLVDSGEARITPLERLWKPRGFRGSKTPLVSKGRDASGFSSVLRSLRRLPERHFSPSARPVDACNCSVSRVSRIHILSKLQAVHAVKVAHG
jgi:hypothetical protein